MFINVNDVIEASINTKEKLKQLSNTIEELGLLISSCVNREARFFLLETAVAPRTLSTFLQS